MTDKRIVDIHLSTRNVDIVNSAGTSDVAFRLPEIKGRVTQIRATQVHLVHTFYNVNRDANELIFSTASVPAKTSVLIANGQYTPTEFATDMKAAIEAVITPQTVTITPDTTSLFFRVQCSEALTIYQSELSRLFGYRAITMTGSSPYPHTSCIASTDSTPDGMMNLTSPNKVHVCIRGSDISGVYIGEKRYPILATVSLDADFGDLSDITLSLQQEFRSCTSLSRDISVYFMDETGRQIPNNGIDWSFLLQIVTVGG